MASCSDTGADKLRREVRKMDNGTENQAVEKTGEEKYLSALTSFGNYYTALVCLAAGALG